jgi:hypothetical protein
MATSEFCPLVGTHCFVTRIVMDKLIFAPL